MEKRDDQDHLATSVTIFGREIVLQSQEAEEYTKRVSDFVDRRMTKIADEKNTADVTQVAIMAALDIADQLIQKKTKRETDTQRARDTLRRLSQYLDGIEDGKTGKT